MGKDTNRKMWLSLLMCVAVLIGCVTCGVNPDEEIRRDDRVEGQCNRQIPATLSVSVGEECASSQNCQQVNAECVEVRSDYCECKVVEERMIKKWKRKSINKMKKYCKKREGHSCSRKSKCQKKYRKREKKCRHPSHICCTKCKNLEGYECVPKRECKRGYAKRWYQCSKRSKVCCKIQECQSDALDEHCEAGRCECSVSNSECISGTCQCKPGYEAHNGACKLECQSGALDEFCEAGRCECSADNSECISGTCQCKPGYEANNGACQIAVPAGYVKMDGLPGYLKVVPQTKSWEDARADCQDDDPLGRSDLVSIESQQKNDEVKNILLTTVTDFAWIGLKQKTGERWEYQWTSGVDLTAVAGELTSDGSTKPYRNFELAEQIDEDSHDNQDCIGMFGTSGVTGTWSDWTCNEGQPYVCEFP